MFESPYPPRPFNNQDSALAVVVKPEFAELLRVAYDPALPSAANDAVFALRLSARLGLAQS